MEIAYWATNRNSAGDGVVVLATREVQAQVAFTKKLGSFMSAMSLALGKLCGKTGEMQWLEGSIVLDEVRVERLSPLAFPLKWRLVLRSGPYRYEATADGEAEHVLLACEGGMKFLAFKCKQITLEDEVCYSREEAAKLGLLTKEDG